MFMSVFIFNKADELGRPSFYQHKYIYGATRFRVPTFSVQDGIRTSLLEHQKNHSLRSAIQHHCYL